jgi:hypothetical protein
MSTEDRNQEMNLTALIGAAKTRQDQEETERQIRAKEERSRAESARLAQEAQLREDKVRYLRERIKTALGVDADAAQTKFIDYNLSCYL